jgi:anti-sigma B factor antagonist
MALQTKVEYNYDEEKWVFKLIGEIDIYTSNEFRDEVLKAYQQKNADLVIDAENLEYIDSTGLGALIGLLKMMQDTPYKIYIDNIKPNIRKLFDITKLDSLFIFRGENNEQ